MRNTHRTLSGCRKTRIRWSPADAAINAHPATPITHASAEVTAKPSATSSLTIWTAGAPLV